MDTRKNAMNPNPHPRRVCGVPLAVLATWIVQTATPAHAADDTYFRQRVAPLFEQHCLHCHGPKSPRGGLSLATAADLHAGGDSGAIVVAGKPRESLLLSMVSGAKPKMPKKAAPLTAAQVAILTKWIAEGVNWPKDVVLQDRGKASETWWSLRPLVRPAVPAVNTSDWVRTPIDAFILHRLERQGMKPSAEADRRTLIRRLYFDLIGLPPTPTEIDAFVRDRSPDAYERLVDRLLDSPRYGERWARHWLDVVHYGDTHGYDKDKVRPNAWPYRDYVIRAFNEDRRYSRFIKEQIAGDVCYPDSRDGIVGLGFLAAGPWDFVGQVELREGTLDKKITRNLDRDDIVATVMNTFDSLTVQCARCHDHKFDPIAQEDYYSLQAVFAAVDRVDRPDEVDAGAASQRLALKKQLTELEARKRVLQARLQELAGPELARIERQIKQLLAKAKGPLRPEYGYHSGIEARPNVVKWVQIDLGRSVPIESIAYVGCHDTFNSIGAGFGFPARYKIEIGDDAVFKNAAIVADHTSADVSNPGIQPQSVAVGGKSARYIRITATKLAPRSGDFIFALAEVSVFSPQGKNLAAGALVTSLDSIEATPRWRRTNLVDGYYHGVKEITHLVEVARLNEERRAVLARVRDAAIQRDSARIERDIKEAARRLAALPPPGLVYAASTHFAAAGGFAPTNGKPRPIYLLKRGSEKNPLREVGPGTVACVSGLPSRFPLAGKPEGERRAALARWITDERNPLTWRSIVNRVWLYHFGQGLVDTPNDFGRMGGNPSHAELLDWLAVEFRDGGQSLKQLHRLIVNSSTYRQASRDYPAHARLDGGNRLLWRMNRRRLDAESIRDAVLAISGKLDLKMYGPGFRTFGFLDDHSPHYKYDEYNPDDSAGQRRSVYRFLVRSVPDPFMETLDCPDPSLRVEKRNESLTALQALALLNDKFMLRMAEHFAARVEKRGGDLSSRVAAAYRLALGREPKTEERRVLIDYAGKHGLANACRLILNMNEFAFID
jgi:mono/diheme cytochrome c family protein